VGRAHLVAAWDSLDELEFGAHRRDTDQIAGIASALIDDRAAAEASGVSVTTLDQALVDTLEAGVADPPPETQDLLLGLFGDIIGDDQVSLPPPLPSPSAEPTASPHPEPEPTPAPSAEPAPNEASVLPPSDTPSPEPTETTTPPAEPRPACRDHDAACRDHTPPVETTTAAGRDHDPPVETTTTPVETTTTPRRDHDHAVETTTTPVETTTTHTTCLETTTTPAETTTSPVENDHAGRDDHDDAGRPSETQSGSVALIPFLLTLLLAISGWARRRWGDTLGGPDGHDRS
jgi:hypothetical protein